jgi:hypothetical protein
MESEFEVLVGGFEHLTPEERHRARRADAIYDAAFTEAGLKQDAFQKAAAWVEFVRGLIDEEGLWAKVMAERGKRAGYLGKAA